MTLLGVKASTKDIDLIVPDISEHEYLINILKQLGYKSESGWGWARDGGFVFDLFRGKAVHTTELLESPLKKGNHVLIKEFSHIYQTSSFDVSEDRVNKNLEHFLRIFKKEGLIDGKAKSS